MIEISASSTGSLDDLHRGAVERVIAMMRQEPSRPLSLADLASVGLFSRYHFHRMFRSVTAETPARFLAALRMADARRMLLHTSFTVAQIGSSVGYSSTGTFATQFTRLVGTSPLRFRELARRHAERSINCLLAAAAVAVTLPTPYALMTVFLRLVGGPTAGVRSTASRSCAMVLEPNRTGVYEARVQVVSGCATPTQALVDGVNWTSLIGTTRVVVDAAGRLEHPADVVLRPPRITDPPLLSAAPLRWLDNLSAHARRVPDVARPAARDGLVINAVDAGDGRVVSSIIDGMLVAGVAA
jgi:AraC-like DNA-binding protein